MLNKLLKYDLKWIYKLLIVFYILALIFSGLVRIFGTIDNSLIFHVVSEICKGAAISMMVSSLINTLMRLWTRFSRNIYKDESYLTHTLPVEKTSIFNSKVLTGIITIFTAMILILVCLFICYYSKETLEALKSLLELAASTYDTTVVNLILLVSLVIFLEIVYALLIGYVGIIIGHKYNKNKMAKSIIISFALYFLFQGLTLALIAIFGLFNPDIMNLINTTDIVNVESIKNVMYIGIIIYIIYSIVLYIVGQKLLKQGVNVE